MKASQEKMKAEENCDNGDTIYTLQVLDSTKGGNIEDMNGGNITDWLLLQVANGRKFVHPIRSLCC
jgi:hypothetical protein